MSEQRATDQAGSVAGPDTDAAGAAAHAAAVRAAVEHYTELVWECSRREERHRTCFNIAPKQQVATARRDLYRLLGIEGE